MFIYLASPYSVTDPISEPLAAKLRKKRFEKVCKLAAELMLEGHTVFCPIAHSHPIEVLGMKNNMQKGDFWLAQDFKFLANCTDLYVYMMEGWDRSHGVRAEIEYAEQHNIPIKYIPNRPVKLQVLQPDMRARLAA